SIQDDLALSLRLSNGYSASLNYAQLQANAGTSSIAEEARIDKEPGSRSSSSSPSSQEDGNGDGFGTVYLSCCVRSVTAEAAAAAAGTPSSKLDTKDNEERYFKHEAAGYAYSGFFHTLSFIAGVLLPGKFRKQELNKNLDDGDGDGSKLTGKSLVRYTLCLIGVAVVLSTSGLLKTASTLSTPPPPPPATTTTATGAAA
ncbi:unnamed protein product, partial [Laminaria digitata]